MHVMMFRITGFQGAQHQTGRLIIRLVHSDHLKTPLQGCVTFKVLFVLRPGGGGNGAQFTPRQRRLQQVGRIRAASLITGPDKGMGFIYKQQNRSR